MDSSKMRSQARTSSVGAVGAAPDEYVVDLRPSSSSQYQFSAVTSGFPAVKRCDLPPRGGCCPRRGLAVEHADQTLSRYDVSLTSSKERFALENVTIPRPFAPTYGQSRPQLRLFALEALDEDGWLKALRLHGYALRSRKRLEALQGSLFPYRKAL